MEETLALNASDCNLLEEISNTPEVSETSPSPIRRRLRSSILDSSNAIGPSPPHRPRGRTGLRRPSDTGDSRRFSPTRSRSRRASDRRNRPEATSPGQHAVRPSATGIADWTVASLKRSLTHHNIPFHHSDRKATLLRHLRNFLHNSTSRTPLPGRRRHDDDVTPPSSARHSHSALTQGQLPLQLAPAPSLSIPPCLLTSSCSLPLYPPLPSNHSLATAAPPASPTASPRPSPVSSTLRQQILSGNYVDLAQLIHPSTYNPHIPIPIHLLDDFLTVTPPSFPPSHGLTTMVSVFTNLGVPLSAEKTEGPSTSLEFLGITLDSISLQASLPIEKIHRTSLLISNFLLAHRCTKRQLLSLLGHLNYAIRIIPQGRSFLSHLLSIATSTPNLHDHITLNEASKMELKLWHHFLSSWNGISFFYDDHITKPEDIQLFTDAAPSAGFGGFYSGKWFAAAWPHEFPSLPHSSTIHEIYPIIIAGILWGHEWSKKTIAIYSDNSAAVDIINKGWSHSLDIMQFICRLTLVSAQHQFIIRASHIPGHKNAIADSLSRFSLQKFKLLAPDSDPLPTLIPPYSATIFN
ncbi:uncharacterized protein LOC109142545 [Larimichthys crocea]|uniref:uncharacterized protein LOC109142545 n=1 Tax=Larimichthys crocea TaxID=215358 RepID=UPI000F5E96D2|nr:uncharacterized protein LOC109142545 [Larimichthys crocea]